LGKNNTFSGWGNFPVIKGELTQVSTKDQLIEAVNANETVIPYGNGRSYGDNALNDHMIHYNNPINPIKFNQESGIGHINAATQIGDLIDYILPFGWFPPVVPGTKFVTIGGAIAADIHGKNHHVDGCFSQHIISIDLMLQNGDIVQCSHHENSDLFKATCGGMGLTGVILNATIKMIQVQSRFIEQISYKIQNIDELFSHFHRYDSKRYSVAWLDCTSKGNKLGRGVLITGEFLKNGELSGYNTDNHSRLNIPYFLPSWLINHLTLKIFNTLYYHLSGFNERKKVVVDLNRFFFPLDQILNWNRLYGKSGFLQYQFVLPLKKSKEGMGKILNIISKSGQGSPLAVLKLFGPKNKNYLSFPMEGFTLALDFKNQPALFPLLDELDKIVSEYEGRVYIAKDARIKEKDFESGYSQIKEFRRLRHQENLEIKFQSHQSRRLGL
jgi:decaprenylphospho-beta-D-ribofuranose 2-oxidase